MEHQSQKELLESVRRIIREELHNVEFIQKKEETVQTQAGSIDDNVLDFLLALQMEGDGNI